MYAHKIVTITEGTPYDFSIASPLKRRPISVHKQNKAYIRLYCRPKPFKNYFIHSCTIKARDEAPQGTFALFRKTTDKQYKPLFYINTQ